MKTPNQEAAERIMIELREKEVLKEASLSGLENKLKEGKLSESEWIVVAKTDLIEGAQNDDNPPSKDDAEVD